MTIADRLLAAGFLKSKDHPTFIGFSLPLPDLIAISPTDFLTLSYELSSELGLATWQDDYIGIYIGGTTITWSPNVPTGFVVLGPNEAVLASDNATVIAKPF